jgi:hypothetical protein
MKKKGMGGYERGLELSSWGLERRKTERMKKRMNEKIEEEDGKEGREDERMEE